MGSSYEKYQRHSSQLQVAVIQGHQDLQALNREVAERQLNLNKQKTANLETKLFNKTVET